MVIKTELPMKETFVYESLMTTVELIIYLTAELVKVKVFKLKHIR